MKYEINGKEATREEAQAYLDRLGYNPHLGREVNTLAYMEGEAQKMMILLDSDSYSYCGLTIKNN